MLYTKFFKSILDRLIALLAIILLSPIFIPLYLLVLVKIGSPVFFKQQRPGYKGVLFTIYKFRTMTDNRDTDGNLLLDEKRLTKFGLFLRNTSLDELPELLNILKGEMSFVGPRPLLKEYLPLYSKEQNRRHEVKPGITGWAQINGRNAITWQKKFELDLWYLDHLSITLDIKIIVLTLLKVIHQKDINQEGQATVEYFNGNN